MTKPKKKPKRELEEVVCPVCGKVSLKGITTKPRCYSRLLCNRCYQRYRESRREARASTLAPVAAPCGRTIKPGPLGTRGDHLRCILECSIAALEKYWFCLDYAAERQWDGWEVV